MLTILYVGPDGGTSRHRFLALQRLGHQVEIVDPFQAFRGHGALMSLGFKTGYLGLERLVTWHVLSQLRRARYDLVWIDNGEIVGPRLVRALRARADVVLNHNLDNPFTDRDGARWRLFLGALPVYDFFATPRESSRVAALARGARNVGVFVQSADEILHRPVELSASDRAAWSSDISFVGTWMPERGRFLVELVRLGLPLRIFGPRWSKAPEFPELRTCVIERSLGDADYAKAIAGSKIAIGLLSAGNLDVHTTRSLEIPAIGALLCAQRTPCHEALYVNGEEAIFFDDAEDCARKCANLLADPQRLAAVANAGHARALRNAHFNERACADIIDGALRCRQVAGDPARMDEPAVAT